jgi:hypothetical protein
MNNVVANEVLSAYSSMQANVHRDKGFYMPLKLQNNFVLTLYHIS